VAWKKKKKKLKHFSRKSSKTKQSFCPMPLKRGETVHDTVNRYKQKESLLNWIDRYLERRARDTERRRDTSTMSNSGKGD
jgi:ribosomal protein L44E